MMRHTHVPEQDDIDIALVEIKAEPEAHFEDIVPLQVSTSPVVAVSEEVFVCGFPYGNMLLEPEGKPVRFGPMIQQGYVSGLSPFAGSDSPEEILLDVRTGVGMSGSPVVRSGTGEVIGIQYESLFDKNAITTTSFGIPLDSSRVSAWLVEFGQILGD
jgi:S1-C subfamily serine protease